MMLLLMTMGCSLVKGISNNSKCAKACDKLYLEDGDCQIKRPGDPTGEETYDVCMETCFEAMENDCRGIRGLFESCEVGDYDPEEKTPSSESITLENRPQAELWLECIEDKSCELLTSGFCAPIW